MVLSEIDDASPTGAQSNADPYASPGNDSFVDAADSSPSLSKNAGYRLDLKKYPRPFPILGYLMGLSDERAESIIVLHSARNALISGRPVTQSEFEAQAYHDARLISTASYGAPIGLLAAAWRERKTRSTFGFPFWLPKRMSQVNTNQFLALRGAMAQSAWSGLRKLAYYVPSGCLGAVLFLTYAMNVNLVDSVRDPRLREVLRPIKTMTAEQKEKLSELTTRLPRDSSLLKSLFAGGPSPEGSPAVPSKWLGMQGESYSEDSTADNGYATRDMPPDFRNKQAREPRKPSHEEIMNRMRGVSEQGSPQHQPSSDGLFDVDDASPTAGSAPPPSASAWDNLRQQAMPQNQKKWGQGPDQGGRQGDAWASRRSMPATGNLQSPQDTRNSYTFSSSEEDKQLARDEAQKDFDARVDRERRGEDFGSSSRRW